MYSKLFYLVLLCMAFNKNVFVNGKAIPDDSNPLENNIVIPVYGCNETITNSRNEFILKVDLPTYQSEKCTWIMKAPKDHGIEISSFGVFNGTAPSTSTLTEDGIYVAVYDYDAIWLPEIVSIITGFGEELSVVVDYDHQKRTHHDANLAVLFTIKYYKRKFSPCSECT